jgi:hypothetical protein
MGSRLEDCAASRSFRVIDTNSSTVLKFCPNEVFVLKLGNEAVM